MYQIFFIHSSVHGHLGCFQIMAIGKKCFSEHWGTYISFQIMVFSGQMPRSGIAGSNGMMERKLLILIFTEYLLITWVSTKTFHRCSFIYIISERMLSLKNLDEIKRIQSINLSFLPFFPMNHLCCLSIFIFCGRKNHLRHLFYSQSKSSITLHVSVIF